MFSCSVRRTVQTRRGWPGLDIHTFDAFNALDKAAILTALRALMPLVQQVV